MDKTRMQKVSILRCVLQLLISTNSDADLWLVKDFATLSLASRLCMKEFYNISLSPDDDAKIVLGDFSAKVGREGFFSPTVGQWKLGNRSAGCAEVVEEILLYSATRR